MTWMVPNGGWVRSIPGWRGLESGGILRKELTVDGCLGTARPDGGAERCGESWKELTVAG